jgi:hypothetical protein
MTRRQIHAILLLMGSAWLAVAYLDAQWYWLNRSDLWFAGLLIAALGLHGLWKRDPR